MAETPATRTSLQRTPPPSLPYKLEIDQLKRRLALVAGGTDAAELTALLAAREDDVARLCGDALCAPLEGTALERCFRRLDARHIDALRDMLRTTSSGTRL